MKKHPKNQPCDQQIILPDINTIVEPVIFERIDGDSISQYARNITHGSGGRSGIDADTSKNLICSTGHGTQGMQLSEEIAHLPRGLCTEKISFEYISTLMSCRLVQLNKSDNSIRPVILEKP